MPRYIDADLLMKELGITDPDCVKCEWGSKLFPYCTRDSDFVDACDAICEAPTADVVEVVRCKDCKHNPKYEWFTCPAVGLNEKQRPETAWCWKGERREDVRKSDSDDF